MPVRSRAVAAAVRLLEQASDVETLALLTVEALRNEMRVDGYGAPPSPVRLARAFSRPGRKPEFDRASLVVAVVEWGLEDILDAAQRQAHAYMEAAVEARGGAGLEPMIATVHRHLREHEPAGYSNAVNARERIFYLSLALADDERTIARLLRDFLRRNQEIYEEVVEVYLALFRRRLAAGVSAADLIRAGHGYVRGSHVYTRTGAAIDQTTVADTLLRIVWSHTVPVDAPEVDVIAELSGAIRSGIG
jgi:hypothetical protein